MKRRAFLTTLAATALFSHMARAETAPIFSPDGLAIQGYDPVAYFTQDAAVEGSAAHRYSWNGAEWRFSSAENRTAFAENPEKYAPQYGGYCAYGASKGGIATTSPDAFTIVEGKLYLNYNKGVRRLWQQDIPGHIARADANWPDLLK